MSEAQEPIVRNAQRTVTVWHVTHPDGHVYVFSKLDGLLKLHNATRKQLQQRGWRFQVSRSRA